MQSILRKVLKRKMIPPPTTNYQLPTPHPSEHRLLVLLAKYPETVFQVGQSLHLSTVAQYLFELSKTFSEYYDQVPVLSAPKDQIAGRVQMVRSVAQVLKNGLALLGIDPVDEM
jgi:arginyl-tRNA synthetase